MDVGAQLRKVREAAKVSQRTLAKKAGVTNSTISLIEANRTNPSVGALKRILDAVPLGLSEFFAFETSPAESIVYRADELKEIGKGAISYRQVGDCPGGTGLQILDETYQPGADTGRIPLRHEGEEGGVVISGRLELCVDDERYVLGPGDAYRFDSSRPHRFRSYGSEPVRVISACTPPSF